MYTLSKTNEAVRIGVNIITMDSKVDKFREGQRKVAEMAFNNKGRCRGCGTEWPMQVLANGHGLCPKCQNQRSR